MSGRRAATQPGTAGCCRLVHFAVCCRAARLQRRGGRDPLPRPDPLSDPPRRSVRSPRRCPRSSGRRVMGPRGRGVVRIESDGRDGPVTGCLTRCRTDRVRACSTCPCQAPRVARHRCSGPTRPPAVSGRPATYHARHRSPCSARGAGPAPSRSRFGPRLGRGPSHSPSLSCVAFSLFSAHIPLSSWLCTEKIILSNTKFFISFSLSSFCIAIQNKSTRSCHLG